MLFRQKYGIYCYFPYLLRPPAQTKRFISVVSILCAGELKKLCRGILQPLHSDYPLYQSFLLSVQLCRRKLKKLYTHTRIRAHIRTRTREEVQKFSCTPAQHTKTTAREPNKCAGGFSSSCTIHLFSCTLRLNACKLRFYLCRRIFQQGEQTPNISATRSQRVNYAYFLF